jgi:hypothetical protein
MSGSGVVVFDYGAWSTRFPELAAVVAQPLAQQYFQETSLYLDNTPASRVQDLTQRALLLNLLVAHIAWLYSPLNTAGAAGLSGRIAGASEGSVSVTLAASALPGTAEWYALSRYGMQYWAATASLRTMQYMPGQGAAYRRQIASFPTRFGRGVF